MYILCLTLYCSTNGYNIMTVTRRNKYNNIITQWLSTENRTLL